MGKFIRRNVNRDGSTYKVASSTASIEAEQVIAAVQSVNAIYGSGSDGSLNFDGISVVLGITPSSNVYSLNRDIYCYNMTVSSNVRINPNGYRIFVQNNLHLGSNSVIGYISGFSTAGSIQQGGAVAASVTHSLGGDSETQTATRPSSSEGGIYYYYQPNQSVKGYSVTASFSSPIFLRGGAGGSSGLGGGVVILAANKISVISGTSHIKAVGDSGSGGGGGGVIIVISSNPTLNSAILTDVSGGENCQDGTVIYSKVM